MSEAQTVRDKPAGARGGGGSAENEAVLALDEAFYDRIKAAMLGARSRFALSEVFGAEKERAEAFLYWEARLLDSGRYRDWADLLADDFLYWVPGDPKATDPRLQGSVNFDDRRRILDRITLTETNVQWSQVPRSRTCRMITNVEVFRGEDDGLFVRSNVAIWEHRQGRGQCYVGWQEHALRPDGENWRIARKFINLLDCDQPQGNITFIL